MLGDTGFNGVGDGPSAKPMPGRARWLAWCWGSFAVSVAAVTATGLVAPDLGPASAILLIAQLVVLALGPLLRRLRLRRLLVDRRFHTVSADGVDPATVAAIMQSGVRGLTVRMGPVGGFARTFRAGPQAVILVHERLPLRPEAARFLIAHESAHIARYDQVRRPAVMTTILICWMCLATIWLPAAAIAAVPAIAAVAVYNRAMELDCDRLGARTAGPEAAEQAIALIQDAHRRTPRSLIRTVRSLLTYPSPRRRLAALAQTYPLAHRAAAGPPS